MDTEKNTGLYQMSPDAAEAAIQELAASAMSLAAGNPPPACVIHRIDALLEAGADEVLVDAVRQTGEMQGYEPAMALRDAIEACATRSPPDARDSDEQTALMAIALQVFAHDKDVQFGGPLLNNALFGRVAQSLINEQLLSRNAMVRFVPYLYEEDELSGLDFCGMRRLSGAVFSHGAGTLVQENVAPALLQTAAAERSATPGRYSASYRLMFLLMTVQGPASELAIGVTEDGGGAGGQEAAPHPDVFEDQKVRWSTEAQAFFTKALGGDKVSVHAAVPAPLGEALRIGAENFRSSRFNIRLQHGMATCGVPPADLSAHITSHGDGGFVDEYRVVFQADSTDKTLFALAYTALPWELCEVIEEALVAHLGSEGFSEVTIDDALYAMDDLPHIHSDHSAASSAGHGGPTLH